MKKFLKLAMTSPLRKLLTGSMIITSTSAGTFVAPSAQNSPVWSDVRRELEINRASAELVEELEAVLRLYQAEQIDLQAAIRLSYIQAGADQRDDLDELWAEYLAARNTGVSIEAFLALRGEAIGRFDMNVEQGLQGWLWKAGNHDDDYDCVASGGTGNCGVGEGLDGGNGTGNEGNNGNGGGA